MKFALLQRLFSISLIMCQRDSQRFEIIKFSSTQVFLIDYLYRCLTHMQNTCSTSDFCKFKSRSAFNYIYYNQYLNRICLYEKFYRHTFSYASMHATHNIVYCSLVERTNRILSQRQSIYLEIKHSRKLCTISINLLNQIRFRRLFYNLTIKNL